MEQKQRSKPLHSGSQSRLRPRLSEKASETRQPSSLSPREPHLTDLGGGPRHRCLRNASPGDSNTASLGTAGLRRPLRCVSKETKAQSEPNGDLPQRTRRPNPRTSSAVVHSAPPAAASRCGEPPPPPPDLGLARVTRFGQWDVSPRETSDGLQRACTAGFVSGTPVRRAHPGDPAANPRRSSTLREQNRTQPGPADPGVHEPRTNAGRCGPLGWAGLSRSTVMATVDRDELRLKFSRVRLASSLGSLHMGTGRHRMTSDPHFT